MEEDPCHLNKNSNPSSSSSSSRLKLFRFQTTCRKLCFDRRRIRSTFSRIENGGRPGILSERAQEQEQASHERRRMAGGCGGAVAPVATAAAGHPVLRAMRAPCRRAPEGVQHVLPRLRRRRPLLAVPCLPPPRPPHDPDSAVIVPRRDPGVGDPEGARHRRRADLHHQQRPDRLPQRAPPAEARQGRRQHLRGLRPEPPRLLLLLLPRLQGRRPRHRQEVTTREATDSVGIRRLIRELQPRYREDAKPHPLNLAAGLRRPEEEGHPPQGSLQHRITNTARLHAVYIQTQRRLRSVHLHHGAGAIFVINDV